MLAASACTSILCAESARITTRDGLTHEVQVIEETDYRIVVLRGSARLRFAKADLLAIQHDEPEPPPEDVPLPWETTPFMEQLRERQESRQAEVLILSNVHELIDRVRIREAISAIIKQLESTPSILSLRVLLLALAEREGDLRVDMNSLEDQILWSAPWDMTSELHLRVVSATRDAYRAALLGNGSGAEEAGRRYAQYVDYETGQPMALPLISVLGRDPKTASESAAIRLAFLAVLIAEANDRQNEIRRRMVERERTQVIERHLQEFQRDLAAHHHRYFNCHAPVVREQL